MHWFWRAIISVAAAWICLVVMTPLFDYLRAPLLHGLPLALNNVSVYRAMGALFMLGTISVALASFGLLTYWTRTPFTNQTRCRKCGYILRGITEPRCPECGERI